MFILKENDPWFWEAWWPQGQGEYRACRSKNSPGETHFEGWRPAVYLLFCPRQPAHCSEFSKWLRLGRLCRLEQGMSEASGSALLFNCWISFFILLLKCLALIGGAISIRLFLRSIHITGLESPSLCDIQTPFEVSVWLELDRSENSCWSSHLPVSPTLPSPAFLPTETLWTREPQNQESIAGQFYVCWTQYPVLGTHKFTPLATQS